MINILRSSERYPHLSIAHHENMLISPQRIYRQLHNIVSADPIAGAHTALLIIPQGQLVSSASTFGFDSVIRGSELDDIESETPWLDGPERLRLLHGLASQWEEDESPRVECEVRLLRRIDESQLKSNIS